MSHEESSQQAATPQVEKGLWLADVFNVLYRGCDMIMPEKQIGTIKVSDDQNDHYLYKVVDADMTKSSLQQIDELMLNGPEISSISAEDSLKIDVDLFCGAFKDTLYIDDCPSDDSIETDSPLEMKIVSEDGKGEIYLLYAIFDNAVEAHLEVKLFATFEVYGCIAASTSKIEVPGYAHMLFLERPYSKTKAGPLNPPNLLLHSKSVVAVPLESELLVDIHLMRGDEIDIHEGTVSFVAKRTGISTEVVRGAKWKIELEICWKCGT
ncbi:uncharacterized protein LOC108197382 [Daucus carota subsp. sativus]|uniref:uncharacterized protein LOC108197382 n=1 Tax=Daucus carota subsp. sativus TaxID=79200 RepID=UPI0007EF7235|nr:PREDICTED: uncharacterized protein LOC108197382 [Daucus carota subsp. sativus]